MLEDNLITLQELRDCQSFIEQHKVDLLCIKDYSIVNVCCEILDRESKSILFTIMNCDCVYVTGSSYSFWKDKLSKLTENIEVIRENINQRNSYYNIKSQQNTIINNWQRYFLIRHINLFI